MTHRINLNTDERQCQEDKEYNVVRCMENFVSAGAGCSLPWNQYPDENYGMCVTSEQYNETLAIQFPIFVAGAPQFQDLTGCLPPCEYLEFHYTTRTFENPHITAPFGGDSVFGVALSLVSTNHKVWMKKLNAL